MKKNNVKVRNARPQIEENTKHIGADFISAQKKNEGITLIALIITIIIMLILVVVSVRIALNTRLFESAGIATKDWKTAQESEMELGNGKVNIGGVWYDSMEDYVHSGNTSAQSETLELSLVNTPVAVIADGTKVKEIKESAPIPVDFYYVGGTMKTGIVISDNSTDENKGADAELIGNQFVWVPVPQNQKLKLEIESKEKITSLKIEDPLYREITTDKNGNTISPSGTSYTVEVNPTINGLYTVTLTTGEESIEKTIRVSSLYAQDFYIDYFSDFYVTEAYYKDIYGYDSLQELLGDLYGEGTTIDDVIAIDLDNNLEYSDSTISNYAASVNKYGGFYIAKYEAKSETARTSSSGITDTIYSKNGMYSYNYITQPNAIIKASGMYNKTSITSAIINAAAWDRTLNWLMEIGEIPDGRNPYTRNTGNLIDDLTGWKWEWTTEKTSSSRAVNRGGMWGGDFDPPTACRSASSPDRMDSEISFRVVLYIK